MVSVERLTAVVTAAVSSPDALKPGGPCGPDVDALGSVTKFAVVPTTTLTIRLCLL
jgi:hypothetical protein